VSLIASLALSFTLVPVLFSYLMRRSSRVMRRMTRTRWRHVRVEYFRADPRKFEDGFNSLRKATGNVVAYCVRRGGRHTAFFFC